MTDTSSSLEAGPGPGDRTVAEWQTDASGFAALQRWLRELPSDGDVQVGPPIVTRIHDLYFDTADWRLHRADVALRIRREGRAIEARLEATTQPEEGRTLPPDRAQPLSRRSLAAPFAGPGPVAARLRLLCRPHQLRLLADIHTTRRRFPLKVRGAAAGEIRLDRSLPAEARGPEARRHSVRIEIPGPRTNAVRHFVEELRVAGGLAPADAGRLAWALAARGLTPAWPRGVGVEQVHAEMTLGEAAHAVLRKHFAAVLRHEPGTRLGEDPEHLHDMRVGTRRMRAALRIFSEALPARDAERLGRGLHALGQALGKVRDLDVQAAQLRGWRASLITVGPEALDPLLDWLEARRQAARADLIRFLDSARYRRLKIFLRGWLRRGPVARRPESTSLLPTAGARILRRSHRKFMRQAQAIDEAAAPEALHRLRILGKRARYSLEFLEPVYGAPAEAIIRAFVDVQDILGLHQDAHVCMAALPPLAAEGSPLPPGARPAIGEIAQMYAASAARQRELLSEALRKVGGRRWKALKRAMETAAEVEPRTQAAAASRSPRRVRQA